MSTVVKTIRDLELPPAPPSYEDRGNIQSGTAHTPRLERSRVCSAPRNGAALRPGHTSCILSEHIDGSIDLDAGFADDAFPFHRVGLDQSGEFGGGHHGGIDEIGPQPS